jgi:DNA mismatch repair protein MSH4
MHVHTPHIILVPDTFLSSTNTSLAPPASATRGVSSSSLSVQFIREEFPQVPIEPVPRKYWNDSAGQPTIDFSRIYTLNYDRLGYQFIAQFCVEDDERAATLVSVTDKSLYAHISASTLLIASVQILYTLSRMCSFQICRNPPQHSLFCMFSSYTLYPRRGDDDDRPRNC